MLLKNNFDFILFPYNTHNASDPFKLNPVRQTNNYKMADQSAAWPVADAALSQVRYVLRAARAIHSLIALTDFLCFVGDSRPRPAGKISKSNIS
jgi:hypothetical protein